MDALRVLALENNIQTLRKMKDVVLISADPDVDVCLKQAPPVLAAGIAPGHPDVALDTHTFLFLIVFNLRQCNYLKMGYPALCKPFGMRVCLFLSRSQSFLHKRLPAERTAIVLKP